MRKCLFLTAAGAAFLGVAAERLPIGDAEALAVARQTLAKMTLEEKCSLMGGCATMYLNAIPRVGIDREWAFSDATHGMKPEHNRDWWGYVGGCDDRSTCLPCQSALAATWNPGLAKRHGDVMGEQMRARGKDQMLGPGVNIVRTPLCGRNWEYIGEDPYLNAKMCVPLIRAVQSHGVAATVKHFCLNNQELNRFKVNCVVDDRALHEIYLPAYKAAVQEAGVLALMTAYNGFRGTFCSENAYLLRGLLRERWGFKGEIVTDWGGQHSCDYAVWNGCGIEMNCGREIKYLTDFWGTNGKEKLPLAAAVRAGRVTEAQVDEAVLHTLFTMAKTGFFAGKQEKGERFTKRHQGFCRDIGEEAIVLAKNAKGVLPLDPKKTKKLVLVGAYADLDVAHLGSSCECRPLYEITPYKGLVERFGSKVEIFRAPFDAESGVDEPKKIANLMLETVDPQGGNAFVVRAWEFAHTRGGKDVRRGFDPYPDGTWNCDNTNCPVRVGDRLVWKAKVKAPESGDFSILLTQEKTSKAKIELDGKTLVDFAAGKEKSVAKLEKGRVYEFAVTLETGDGFNQVLFGWLPPSMQRVSKDVLRRKCAEADAVIVFTGTEMGWGRAKETEGEDRPDMREPEGHDAQIAELLTWNLPRLVVVNRSGSAMEMPWEPNCDTLVIHSYLGQEAGRPLARVLFGDVSPSGKLPVTWPRRLADTAPAKLGCYNPSNVVYRESFYVGYRWYDAQKIAPMFPFGHGLSYASFEYGPASVTNRGSMCQIAVSVKNTGKVRAKETVQLYVAPAATDVPRCAKELKGFDKVELAPGETKVVRFRLTPKDVAYWDTFASKWHTPKGTYGILIGSSSSDIRARAAFDVAKDQLFED